MNAITFEVFDSAVWLVIGYCGVEKIPRLTKAIQREEIISFKVCYIKRQWIPKIRDLRLHAAVAITKKGRWDKRDSKNLNLKLKTCRNYDTWEFDKESNSLVSYTWQFLCWLRGLWNCNIVVIFYQPG